MVGAGSCSKICFCGHEITHRRLGGLLGYIVFVEASTALLNRRTELVYDGRGISYVSGVVSINGGNNLLI